MFILDKFSMPNNYGKIEIDGSYEDISGLFFSQLPTVVQPAVEPSCKITLFKVVSTVNSPTEPV